MTRSLSTSKVLLVADHRPSASDDAGVTIRRYRLARLRFEGRSEQPASRYEHLKRVYE